MTLFDLMKWIDGALKTFHQTTGIPEWAGGICGFVVGAVIAIALVTIPYTQLERRRAARLRKRLHYTN